MKKLLTVATLIAATLCANAQDIFDNSDNKAYFGARISYELACPSDIKLNSTIKASAFSNGSGLSFGGIYNMPLWKNLYFEPGLMLYYNTYALNKDILTGDGYPINFDEASVRQFGMRIPLVFGYHFDILPELSLSVFTGPEFALGFTANTHVKSGNLTYSESAYGDNGYLNRCDIKWRFGVGATYAQHYHFAISGAAGTCDLYQDDPSMRSNLFDITLGYNF